MTYASDDVYKICVIAEKTIKEKEKNKVNFCKPNIFNELMNDSIKKLPFDILLENYTNHDEIHKDNHRFIVIELLLTFHISF